MVNNHCMQCEIELSSNINVKTSVSDMLYFLVRDAHAYNPTVIFMYKDVYVI